MLSGHSAYAHISTDNYHAVIRHQAYQPKHCCFQILLMAAQVQEGNKFFWIGCDVSPWLVFRLLRSFDLHLIILIVEAHNLLSDRGSAPVGLLVSEVKNSFASWASPIIHDWFSQHPDKGRLARINIPNNCYPRIIVLPTSKTWIHVVNLLKEFLWFFTFLNLLWGLEFGLFHLSCESFYLLPHVGFCISVRVLIWFLCINVLRISAKSDPMLVLNFIKHILQCLSASFALWSSRLILFWID